jgi:hypothetical protein
MESDFWIVLLSFEVDNRVIDRGDVRYNAIKPAYCLPSKVDNDAHIDNDSFVVTDYPFVVTAQYQLISLGLSRYGSGQPQEKAHCMCIPSHIGFLAVFCFICLLAF